MSLGLNSKLDPAVGLSLPLHPSCRELPVRVAYESRSSGESARIVVNTTIRHRSIFRSSARPEYSTQGMLCCCGRHAEFLSVYVTRKPVTKRTYISHTIQMSVRQWFSPFSGSVLEARGRWIRSSRMHYRIVRSQASTHDSDRCRKQRAPCLAPHATAPGNGQPCRYLFDLQAC